MGVFMGGMGKCMKGHCLRAGRTGLRTRVKASGGVLQPRGSHIGGHFQGVVYIKHGGEHYWYINHVS